MTCVTHQERAVEALSWNGPATRLPLCPPLPAEHAVRRDGYTSVFEGDADPARREACMCGRGWRATAAAGDGAALVPARCWEEFSPATAP